MCRRNRACSIIAADPSKDDTQRTMLRLAAMCAQTSSSLTIVGQERLAQELELRLRVRIVVAADTLSTQTDWLGADESITSAA